MTNKTKYLFSLLSLDAGLPFDKATLATSRLATYRGYCRFDSLIHHRFIITTMSLCTNIIQPITITGAGVIGIGYRIEVLVKFN